MKARRSTVVVAAVAPAPALLALVRHQAAREEIICLGSGTGQSSVRNCFNEPLGDVT
jgi:hypothetical protein